MSTPILKTLSQLERKPRQISGKRDTLPFLTLSCKILITCIRVELRIFFYFTGKGILHVKSIWKYIIFNSIRCLSFLRQRVSRLEKRVVTGTGTSDELSRLIQERNWRKSPKYLPLKYFTMPHELSHSRWLKYLELLLNYLWPLWDFWMTFHCN